MFSVLLHGSDQKVWQSLLVKSLQKKNQNNQEKSNQQHVVKSAFFFFAAANATTSGGGGGGWLGNDWVIPNTSEVFQMAFSMT